MLINLLRSASVVKQFLVEVSRDNQEMFLFDNFYKWLYFFSSDSLYIKLLYKY